MSTTLVLDATRIAIRAAGPYPHLREQVGPALSPRVALSRLPAPSDTGWDVSETGAALLGISLRADQRGRTVYLVIDRDSAPLTGNYVVEVTQGATTESVTYDATSSAPADVDALLEGIRAAIAGDAGVAAIVTPSIVVTGAAGTSSDAIRLVGVSSDDDEAQTYIITSNTAFPGAAALAVYGELDTLTQAVLYARPAVTVDSAAAGDGALWSGVTSRWLRVYDFAVTGPISSGGALRRLDLAGMADALVMCVGTLTDTYGGTLVGIAAVYLAPCGDT